MNTKTPKPKRIGIDARFYGPVGKGLGRYAQEVIDNVIKMDTENEYVIFLYKENFNLFQADGWRVKKVLADVRWYTLAEQIVMPWLIFREGLDLMHFPHFNVPVLCPVKFVVTVHDLILTKHPTARATTLGPALYKIKNFFYKIVIWLAVKRARKVIAVSQFTKDDIVRHFHVAPKKVAVTYEGVSGHFRTQASFSVFSPNQERGGKVKEGAEAVEGGKLTDDDMLLKYDIIKPYLLYVGNAYPHKNLEGLIKIFKDLTPYPSPSQERGREVKEGAGAAARLVLVGKGKDDYFYSRVMAYARELGVWDEHGKNSPVVFPGYVPDAELAVIFRHALAYVFPSFYEGFGLPPLEAMAQSCPVASSNKTCLPEVLGRAAVYFNPENEEEMRAVILKITGDESLRGELIRRGHEQVKKYSWENCARQTLGIYQSAL